MTFPQGVIYNDRKYKQRSKRNKLTRVTIIEGSPERIDESISLTRERVIPQAKKMQGFKGTYLLVDRKAGNTMAVTLWETKADLQASTEAANRLRAQATQAAAATQRPKVNIYEVAVRP